MAFQAQDVLSVMTRESGLGIAELRVDGGAAANDALMQLQADILGTEVIRPKVAETTSLGAAYAAGLAVGFWRDLESLRANWQVGRSHKFTLVRDNLRVDRMFLALDAVMGPNGTPICRVQPSSAFSLSASRPTKYVARVAAT